MRKPVSVEDAVRILNSIVVRTSEILAPGELLIMPPIELLSVDLTRNEEGFLAVAKYRVDPEKGLLVRGVQS